MKNIRNIIFDFGGVIITIDQQQAINRFREIGVTDADKRLDSYTQTGIFGELESGKINGEQFRTELEKLAERPITHQDCCYAWQGYCKELPQRNLDCLTRLRTKGYKVILLSNTNPLMMEWAMSNDFDGKGNPIQSYFDFMYLSYECKMMKPEPALFQKVLRDENIRPEETLFVDDGELNIATAKQLGIQVFCPPNGSDWTKEIERFL
ncbi:MAG: HAD family phosphatase [Prevotella sp.]|nr:HAD family phosphatase [Prevotella sp.]